MERPRDPRARERLGLAARLARDLLKDWASEGFLTGEQYRRLEQDTVWDLRRTNIFLRLVLFLFTVLFSALVHINVRKWAAEPFIPASAKAIAGISLALWIGMILSSVEVPAFIPCVLPSRSQSTITARYLSGRRPIS